MNLIGVARHGIGIAGVPPIAISVARGIVIECVRHADRRALVVQAAAPDPEHSWLARLGGSFLRVPLPPGLAFAVRIANGRSVVGGVLVAEREVDLGDRPGTLIRIGHETIELDRRDGSPALPVVPRFLGLVHAEALVRRLPGREAAA